MPLVLGVDSSAASTTVEVRDADTGRLVATGRSSHAPVDAERAEQAPSEWWAAMLAAVAATQRRDVAAMSVAGQQHALVVTDSAGAVLRPAVLAHDRRSLRHVRSVAEMFDPARWVDSVGMVPGADSTLVKLAWLRASEPSTFARVGHLLSPHDWLTFRLTGRMVTDRGDASGTGYWSPTDDAWRTDVLHRFDAATPESEWARRLPTVLGSTAPADWMTASVHEIVGLRGRPIVAAGTGRQMAAALSIGLEEAEVGVSLGTSGGVFAVSNSPARDHSASVRGHADATGRFLPTVPMPRAAAGLAGVCNVLGVDLDGLGRLAQTAPSGSGGVTIVPSTAARGAVVAGVDSSTSPGLVARAAFEGLACTVLDGIESIVTTTGQRIRGPIHVVGVAARSPVFCRVLADLAGVPVAAIPDESPIARGACVQAAAALSGVSPSHITRVWGRDHAETFDPSGSVDADAVRSAYRMFSRARPR